MPPQVNATLTAVKGATAASGGRDDWDNPGVEPTGAGPSKWTGEALAYYRETTDRVFANGEVNVLVRQELYIDAADARASAIDTDDTITFTDPAGVERSANVDVITISELDRIPSHLQTAKLTLRVE